MLPLDQQTYGTRIARNFQMRLNVFIFNKTFLQVKIYFQNSFRSSNPSTSVVIEGSEQQGKLAIH